MTNKSPNTAHMKASDITTTSHSALCDMEYLQFFRMANLAWLSKCTFVPSHLEVLCTKNKKLQKNTAQILQHALKKMLRGFVL